MTYRVAVVCRQKGFRELRQKNGWWAYPVDGFDWDFYPVEDKQAVNKNKLAERGYDFIFWEDWALNGWVGDAPIPIYAAIVDSNTSPRRRKNYVERARSADVLLIDQDKLTPFREAGKPLYRWSYAVNEHIFAPLQKTVDVAYHVARTAARQKLGGPLREHCQEQQHSLTMGGGMTIQQLATRYGEARIVVHKSTYKQCRSHRLFDALASGACLVTDRIWAVNEDRFAPGLHFAEWDNEAHLFEQITDLLTSGRWKTIAAAGRDHVLRHHTWRTRADELRAIVEATWGN